MTSKQHVPFPVSRDDVAAAIAASLQSTVDSKSSHEGSMTPKIFPRAPSPTTSPGSARGTPPPGPGKLALGGSGFVNLMNLSPSSGTTSKNSSRRPSGSGTPDSFPIDSRRGSVKSTADAMRKSVKNVADNTKKATHKVVGSGRQWKDDVEATTKKVMGTTKQLVDGVEEKTKKVKDKTAGMSAQMKVARKGARKWVANHSSKTAKAAMEQAKSGLSGGEKFTLFAFEKITLLSRRGFTHVFMFLILIGYTALGALLFMAFEAPHEEVEKLAIHEKRMAFINYLYNYSGTDYDQYILDAKASLLPFEDQLYKGFAAGVSYDTDDRVWTFWKAMFFCSTITTTIGYGHIAPKTTAGQALTIGYALIGIPIFLILMADFGKLFTRLLKALFIFIRKCYKSNTCKSVRKNKHVKNWKQKTINAIPTASTFTLSSSHPSVTTIDTMSTELRNTRTNLEDISEEEISVDEISINHMELDAKELEKFRSQFRPQNKSSFHRELSVPDLDKVHREQSKKLHEAHYSAHKALQTTQSIPELNSGTSISSSRASLDSRGSFVAVPVDLDLTVSQSTLDGVLNSSGQKEHTEKGCCSATTTKLSAFRDTIFCRWKEDEEEKVEDGKPKKTAEELKAAEEAEDKYFADGNFNLPITLALFILILYMIVGCFVYINWEDWTFFEAFYFIFISMTTIGFGDFVPQHPAFMMATALYLVFGLALTAMCINIIQEKLTDTFREASTKLKTQFSHIMAQSALAGQGEDEDTETETPSMTTIEVTEDGR